ncbi:sulfate ABC transporter substrate-binding protein [Paenibacillus radicis (ex Gao et al. 2016)]|uniref:Sulfate-binding protein n=1 Tax=Paenibacillus radicis (ex Gao et al. 2016) TaxID=1737354 RepID=A0A917HEQ2_9BACL|nr:sulfate ABC transporter substrate-binding protein [Paenibacillus radicis (ex Gao et al. 2016)]GGG76764.1 sulfate-binding protein [Paenibacillus radicis (ex Gao et al. 2016)]
MINNRGTSRRMLALLLAGALLLTLAAGCGSSKEQNDAASSAPDGDLTLVIGAYSVVKDAFEELLPQFQAQWLQQTGQKIVFQQSYEASGTQARAIAGGFEADVAVLAMEGDIDKVVDAGFITYDWKAQPHAGMITRSIVVLGTRAGNPLGITGWDDLTKDGVKVLYPNPKTSGGAQWDINAMYGAGLKKSEEETGKPDPAYAKNYLKSIHANVESLDKSGRASMAAFEYGVGDVIVTYENELLSRIKQGVKYDIVIPRDTILIENPAAVVDKNVDKHGTRKAAEAFVAFLQSEQAQRVLADYGFRPVEEKAAADTKGRYVEPEGMFDISYLGGWKEVRKTLYSKRGVWYQVLAGI